MDLRIFALLVFLLTMSCINQTQEWYVMARHGECLDLAKLTERNNLVKGAKTPSEIKDLLKTAKVDYILEPLTPEQDGMLRFNVPSENWAMLLVKKQFCDEFIEK